jgi:hypothetical protein
MTALDATGTRQSIANEGSIVNAAEMFQLQGLGGESGDWSVIFIANLALIYLPFLPIAALRELAASS